MKKNLIPLLAIAFIIAVVSTAVFYGLFAGKLQSSSDLLRQTIVVAARNVERGTVLTDKDVRISELRGSSPLTGSYSKAEQVIGYTALEPFRENEPLTQSRIASKDLGGGAASGVPSGMRAVSIRVAESTGLIPILHAGNKVDIQAVSDHNGVVELRTILQNINVLSVTPPADPMQGRPAAVVVTVLTRPGDVDVLAIADTGGRLRVALRNPLDEGTEPRRALQLSSIFTNNRDVSTPVAHGAVSRKPPVKPMAVQVQGHGVETASVNRNARGK